jgi:hypothetical protein
MLSAGALTRSRTALYHSLPDLCQVQRTPLIQDRSRTGGTRPGPPAIVATTPARLIALTGAQEQQYADRLGERTGWQVLLPYHPGWQPNQYVWAGMVFAPMNRLYENVLRVVSGGLVGGAEPDWANALFPLTDGAAVWEAALPDTDIDVDGSDMLLIKGHKLDILEIVTGQTWQMQTSVFCAERT